MQPVHERLAGGGPQRLSRHAAQVARDLVGLSDGVPGRRGRLPRHLGHRGDAGPVGRVHHAAQQGDAQAGAELVGRLADGGGAPGLVLGGLAEHRLVGAEERGLQAESQQHETAQQQRRVVPRAHRQEGQHRGRGEHEAGRHHDPRAERAQQPRPGETGRHGGQGQRQHPQTGLQRGQAQHQLEVLRRDEFQAHQRQHGQHDAAEGGAEGRPREQAHVDQRVLAPPLAPHEQHQEQDARDQRAPGQRRLGRDAAAQPLDAVDRGEESDRRGERAGHVPGPLTTASGLRQQHPSDRQRDQHQRDVDQEDRTPPEALEQEPAQQRTDRRADGRDGAPDADGQRALPPVGEDLAEHRQGGGHDHRAADTEQRPCRDEHLGAVRAGGDARGDAEKGVAQQQDPSASHPVAQGAEEDQQRGADEGIDVDGPQQLGGGGPEVLGDRGHRDVEHGGVHRDEQQTDAEDDEDDPAVGAGPGRPAGAVPCGLRAGHGRPGHVRTSQNCSRPAAPKAARPARSTKTSDSPAYASSRRWHVVELSRPGRPSVVCATARTR